MLATLKSINFDDHCHEPFQKENDMSYSTEIRSKDYNVFAKIIHYKITKTAGNSIFREN